MNVEIEKDNADRNVTVNGNVLDAMINQEAGLGRAVIEMDDTKRSVADENASNEGSAVEEEDDEDDEDDEEEEEEDDEEEAPRQRPPLPAYRMSRVHELQRKAHLLNILKRITANGQYASVSLTMNDALDDIEQEVIRIRKEKEIDESLKIARQGFMFGVSALEFVSKKQSFVDVRLDGWSQKVMMDVQENKDYDEVLIELYEKYSSSTPVSPEVKLVMMMLTSAFGYHLANKMSDMMIEQMRQNMPAAPPQSRSSDPASASMNGPSIDINDILSKIRARSSSDVAPDLPAVTVADDTDDAASITSKRSRDAFEDVDKESVASAQPLPPSMLSDNQSEILGMDDLLMDTPLPKKKRVKKSVKKTI